MFIVLLLLRSYYFQLCLCYLRLDCIRCLYQLLHKGSTPTHRAFICASFTMNPPSRPASPKSSNIAVHDLSCASDCPCREKVLKEAFHVFADIYWFAIMPDKMIDPESDSLVERTRVLSPVFIILSREDHHILCDLRKAYDDRETPCFFDFAHGKHIEGVIPKVILLMPPIIVCTITPSLYLC